jgi:hypothetical protein
MFFADSVPLIWKVKEMHLEKELGENDIFAKNIVFPSVTFYFKYYCFISYMQVVCKWCS